ncbi:hypothetical protein K437DRAFT_240305 [Tilletiaria anomala UBC 951]|uniref:Maintenance of telomere capping protein 1 n=1 Tax=Tilletiaria anomala (strain ATCC 24038 / CBS 436.72 / UBC 951) TaxID=1037660 RepID=A0A066VHH4_TILAU|nr:uncharacterized protein K437DRAFT_240305 [Tilletiaria anomala UBC 951]KDN38030.1 hypothetical protein K437DRAFT_240305 [Tilletiaria anomala UBC 951]
MSPKVSVRTAAGARKGKDDVEKLLSDLDSLAPLSSSSSQTDTAARSSSEAATATVAPTASTGKKSGEHPDAQSLLDDLDSLVQRRPLSRGASSRGGTPSKTTSLSRTTSETGLSKSRLTQDTSTASGTGASADLDPAAIQPDSAAEAVTGATSSAPAGAGAGGNAGAWGAWGSVWTQATKLADNARAELEKRANSEQAKELSAKGWGFAQNMRGLLQETGLEKIGADLTQVGRKGWTDIINAVAPPIAAHEIIQVTLSHDMIGYDGISEVVFRTLTRVMEQHAGDSSTEQQLVVNKPPKSEAPATSSTPSASAKPADADVERDINAVEGFEEAVKVAEVNVEQLIKASSFSSSASSSQNAKGKEAEKAAQPADASAKTSSSNSVALPITTCPVYVRIQPCVAPLPWGRSLSKYLYFIILLKDPSNGLDHQTISQAVPQTWLEVPFEQNAWVEQGLTDVLEVALSVIGQDYVNGRMTGRSSASKETSEV